MRSSGFLLTWVLLLLTHEVLPPERNKPKLLIRARKQKGKMIKPKKPKKAAPIPLQTGGAFKIHEPKALTPPMSSATPPTKKSLVLVKKPMGIPPWVARALKLANEEDELEAEKPVEAVLSQPPKPWLLLKSRTGDQGSPCEEEEVEESG
jgi:hypothetical protein